MSGNAMVSWNQFLSFSPLLAKTRAASAVFWPGCAAMKLGAGLIWQTYDALREALPGLGFSSWCCAKPTFAVGTDGQRARRATQLQAYFAQNGIQTVYTLCPNCQRTLLREFDAQVLPAWPLLADYAESHPLAASAFGDVETILHDPCAGREDAASQGAARRILAARRRPYTEFAHCRAQTRCCGRRDMLFLTNPEAAKKLRDARLNEAGANPIVTYCESCVEAFCAAGHQSWHLLEVLFDQQAPRSFAGRVSNARREARHA